MVRSTYAAFWKCFEEAALERARDLSLVSFASSHRTKCTTLPRSDKLCS